MVNKTHPAIFVIIALVAMLIGLLIGLIIDNEKEKQPKEIADNIFEYQDKELYCFKPEGLLIANNPIIDVEYLCIWEQGATIRIN